MIPLRDTIPSRESPFSTWFLIIINTLVFLYQSALPEKYLIQFIYRYGLIPAAYTQGMYMESSNFLPFISNMFLHGSWVHILSNMWMLWLFGDNVEDRMGHIKFLVFYLLCGIIASTFHIVFNPASTVPAIGASGAIAGVMGAYFILYPHSRIITLIPVLFIPLFVRIPAVFYLFLWFLSQLFSGTLYIFFRDTVCNGIAWWAHIGGFLAGMFLQRVFTRRKRFRPFFDDEYIIW